VKRGYSTSSSSNSLGMSERLGRIIKELGLNPVYSYEYLYLEDKYLKLLVPNYNILTEAGSSFGYKHTEIDRQKMKDLYSDARW
jgi:hypothetical protein